MTHQNGEVNWFALHLRRHSALFERVSIPVPPQLSRSQIRLANNHIPNITVWKATSLFPSFIDPSVTAMIVRRFGVIIVAISQACIRAETHQNHTVLCFVDFDVVFGGLVWKYLSRVDKVIPITIISFFGYFG